MKGRADTEAPAVPGLERNAVICASAGTGKTHQLTNIYIAHALGLRADRRPLDPARIAATTFSRAAAQEIRQRLEERLEAIAGQASPAARPGLDAALVHLAQQHDIDEKALQVRAQRALEGSTRSLIDTLHGLAAQVLRRHALELDLNPDFGIADDQSAEDEVHQSVEDVLSLALSEGGPAARAAEQLLDNCGGLESARLELAGLVARLDEEGARAVDLPLCDDPERDLVYFTNLRRRLETIAADQDSKAAGAAAGVLATLASDPSCEQLTQSLEELAATARKKSTLQAVSGDELKAIFDEFESRPEGARQLAGWLSFRKRYLPLGPAIRQLIQDVQSAVQAQRQRRGALGFGDLLRLARDGLRNHPEIALEAADNFDLLLVDEFQDTSQVQRDLLLLLAEAPEHARQRVAGSLPRPEHVRPQGLVIVGDRKQSIYGFRGAEVSVFARLAVDLAGAPARDALALKALEPPAQPSAEFVALRDNRRSRDNILEVVNRIAESDFDAQARYSYEICYTDAERLRSPPEGHHDPGRVSVVTDEGSCPPDAAPLVQAANKGMRTAFVAAGYCAEAHRRGHRFGDIAVLARRRASLPLVELGLDRLGIPFVVAGRALYHAREIRDLLAALRLAADATDKHALAVLARGPAASLTDTALAQLSPPRQGLLPHYQWSSQLELLASEEEQQLAARFTEKVQKYCDIAPRLSPRDAIELALEHFEFDQVLAADARGPFRLGNVYRFMDIAAQRGGNLASFVRWVDHQIRIDADENEAAVFSDEDDAVRLVTIHASKGLAFPVVVLIDLEATEAGARARLRLHKPDAATPQLFLRHRGPRGHLFMPALPEVKEHTQRRARAERQRLSYVALTRAEHELALILPDRKCRAHSLGVTVKHLLETDGLDGIPGVEVRDACDFLAQAPLDRTEASTTPAAPPPRPANTPVEMIAISATALSDFEICPRRFHLLHVQGIDEPQRSAAPALEPAPVAVALDDDDGKTDPAEAGSAAHRILEQWPLEEFGQCPDPDRLLRCLAQEGLPPETADTREIAAGIARFLGSEFARGLANAENQVLRELPLLTRIEASSAAGQLTLFAGHGPSILLKTTLDLAVVRSDGSVDVIDYKRSRHTDPTRYHLQLAAYHQAASRHFQTTRVRTALVHLLDEGIEPSWVEPPPFALELLAQKLAEARWRDRWPNVPQRRCRECHCGFIDACYPKTPRPRKARSS